MIPKPKLRTFRVTVRFEDVDHVYLVKVQYTHHAKMAVFCEVENPPWKVILDELYARYPGAQYDERKWKFTGNDPRLSWSITPVKERSSPKPRWLYSFHTVTGDMQVAS